MFMQEDISSNSALKEFIEILEKTWRTLFKISRKMYKILLKYVFVLWELAVQQLRLIGLSILIVNVDKLRHFICLPQF